jgi:arylsulfatase A-like enzyme
MSARYALLTLLLVADACIAANFPNIVLIVSDNQSQTLLGTYGNNDILTPNIDRLAAEGIKYNRAFAINGVCSPTRATLLTGLLPSQTGVHVALPMDVDVDNWSAIEEFRNLPQTLKDAGYRTTYRTPDHLTDFWTRRAVDFITQQSADRPFFLLLTYNGPYMLPPTVTMEPNNRYAAHYQLHTPSFPQEPVHPFLKTWATGRGPSGLMVREGTTAWTAIEALNNKTAMVNTASETAMVDEGVGKVLDALQHQGLQSDTLVVYTSDQGASYGHHGLWGNTSWSFPFAAYNINMQVPLIFRHLDRIPGGIVTDIMVSQVDFLPTLFDFIGMDDIEIANSPGKSYAASLQGEKIEWDDTVFFEFATVRAIETPKWKYVRRFPPTDPRELYDLESDSDETVNLIDLPAHAEIVAALDQSLGAYFDRYADPKYDLWHGGTAKGRLLEEHYGRDDIFSERFPDWKPPFVEKAAPFTP